jgi:hypothetical protein
MRKVIDELIEHKKIFDELVEVQINSNSELQGIAQDINDISSKLDNFTKLSISTTKSNELDRKDSDAKEEERAKISENKSIYELRKIREALIDNARIDVADKAQQDPAFHTFATRMDAVKEMFGDIKDSFRNRDTGKIGVGSTLKGMARGVSTSFSANARNREEFIKTQKGLGSTRSEKVLKQQYKEQQALLYRNNKNERRMNEARGNLSKEEFLKGGSQKAQEYLKEKVEVGKGLSQVDERYKIKNPEKTDREKDADFFGVGKGSMKKSPVPPAEPVLDNQTPLVQPSIPEPPKMDSEITKEFSSIVDSLRDVITKLSDSIEPMTHSDVSMEDKLETQRTTNTYQDSQLELMNKQNKILDDTFKVQQLILAELKKRTEEITKKADENKSPLDTLKDAAEDKLKDVLDNKRDKKDRPKPTRNNSRKRRSGMGKKGLFGLGAAAAGVGAAEAMDVIDIIPNTPDIVPNKTTTVPETPKPDTTGDIKPGDSRPKPATPETPKKAGFFERAKNAFSKVPGVTAVGDVGSKISESIAKRLPKAALKGALKSIPILGTVAGGIGALMTLSDGDVVGAGLEAASGVGSAITAIPATAALLAREVYEDVYGIKPEDDPEAGNRLTDIKDKVVLELQKVIGTEDVKPSTDIKSESSKPLEAIQEGGQPNAIGISPTSITKPDSVSQEVKPEAIKPEASQPNVANVVYDKSADVSQSAGGSSTVVNNISAPTNNVSTQTKSAPTKFDPRNNDSTVSKLFASRQFY